MEPNVILVNTKDQPIGTMPKMEAHEKGLLHRAVSVLVFNEKGEWLIQKRATSKYHSGGLWTNTCCSHPYPNETSLDAAERRLKEEMGMNERLIPLFSFTYKADLDKGMIEHEYDHVFIGYSDGLPQLNLEEACDFRYISQENLVLEIDNHPEKFTEWFKILVPKVVKAMAKLRKAS